MNDTQMDRRSFLVGGLTLVAAGSGRLLAGEEDSRLTAAKRWFTEAQFGMMAHWGLYSVLAGEYRCKRMDRQFLGEWIQSYYRIPNAEYEKLARTFNPIYFNADEWVQIARDAGMKYLVFTSKHHDGFAMYRSRVSKFNVVDATPFGRDVVGELAEACRKHGLRLGLYYSQDLDWHEPNGGGFRMGKTWVEGSAYWTNNWDFPDDEHKDFSQYFESKAKPQVEEILTQYGDLALIWFDIGSTLSERQTEDLLALCRKHQPGCLINSRISRKHEGFCDYRSAGDNKIPATEAEKKGLLFESPCTLNDTWGYKAHDQNWKSAETIRRNREHLAGLGANYLLNVGPDPLGRIPVPCIDILKAVGAGAREGAEG